MRRLLLLLFLSAAKIVCGQGNYCVPINTYPCSSNDYISKVTFNTINRSSLCDSTGHAYFDTIRTSVYKGNSYFLTIATSPIYAQGASAWIDFNQNDSFEVNEIVLSMFSGVLGAVYTSDVTIPNWALSGNTRLRIRCTYNGYVNDPCASMDYGETEDYLILINNPSCSPPNISIIGTTPDCDSVTLTATGGNYYVWSGGLYPNATTNVFTSSGKYLVQATNAAGCTSTDSILLTINPTVIPSLDINASPGYPYSICEGTTVQFQASNIQNPGLSPALQWTKNGQPVSGATTYIYSTNTLNNHDTVRCVLTSNAACANPATVSSNSIIFTVNSYPPKPVITITASNNLICSGTSVIFTSTVTNKGNYSSYRWQKNGSDVGVVDSFYTYSGFGNNDVVRCIYKDNGVCPVDDTSNEIMMHVTPSVSPSINISSSVQGNCSIAISAKTYNFQVLSGIQLEDLSIGSSNLIPSGNDDYSSVLTTLPFPFIYSGVQYLKFSVSSNGIMGLGDTIVQSYQYYQNESLAFNRQIMPYWDDSYTGTNGDVRYKTFGVSGSRKFVIEWNVRLNSSSSFDRTFQVWLFEATNVIQFVYGNTPISSGSATIGIAASATDYLSVDTLDNLVHSNVRNDGIRWPGQNISYRFSPCSNTIDICQGTPVTFTASISNGGTTPALQWKKNGARISGQTAATYKDSTLASQDVINCQLIGNAVCATADTVISNSIIIDTVATSITPSVTIAVSPSNSITDGTQATFTATAVHAGASPNYQWKINGRNVSTSRVYVTDSLKNHDTVTCQVTSSISCANPTSAVSTPIVMNVDYCTPYTYTYYYYYIQKVVFDSIHRQSTLDNSSTGYSYYNTDSNTTTVHRGNNYALSVTVGAYDQGVEAWIDYNHNNVFDTTEKVMSAYGTINNATVTIPASALPGATRLRIRSSYYYTDLQNNPCNSLSDGETEDYIVNIDAGPCTPPIVNITTDTVGCGNVTLTASGGSYYSWSQGNTPNTATNTFTTTGTYGVTVQVTDSLGCSATKSRMITVRPVIHPTIQIATTDTGIICSGDSIKFTATTTGSDSLTLYHWKKNRVLKAITTVSNYTFTSLANNDSISCTVHNACDSATSNVIKKTVVDSPYIPSVTISVNPGDTINYGTTVIFTARPILGGVSPMYQWGVNGVPVTTLNYTATYSPNTLRNHDIVTCTMISDASCASPGTVSSNPIAMKVGYCIPTSTYACTYNVYTQKVVLNTIHRQSGCDGAYSYFNTDSNVTTLHKGNSYLLAITTSPYSTQDIAAWIDYNKNDYFEPIERIAFSSNVSPGATFSSTIAIPDTAITGTTRLRIRTNAYSTTPNPCDDDYYSETEDYLIIIDSVSSDLIVDSISVPATGYQRRTIPVLWKVRNTGGGATQTASWKDRVYVTASPIYSPGSALAQYDFAHTGSLQPDSFYVQQQDILLPAGISGRFYIHVFTDAFNQVSEYNLGGEDNNVRISDSFHILATMPADLVVTGITLPSTGTATTGQKIKVSWTVKNQGDTAINVSNWYDSVYISPSPVFNAGSATPIGRFLHSGTLAPDSAYTKTALLTMPQLAPGIYYLFMLADAEKNVNEADEQNNKSFDTLTLDQADLKPTLNSVTSLSSGRQLLVQWQDANIKPGTINAAGLTDRIYLSPTSTLNTANALWFDVRFTTQTFAASEIKYRSITLNLPDIVSGTYYVFVYTDYNSEVTESSDSNNISSSFYINLPTNFAFTDIGISDVDSPASVCGLTSQETVKVSLRNYGNVNVTSCYVSYQVDGGAIQTDTLTGINIYPGYLHVHAFHTKANFSSVGAHTVKVYTTLASDTLHSNDSLTVVVNHYAALATVTNMQPQSGVQNLDISVQFSWNPVPNAAAYDLYIWRDTAAMPPVPVVANLTQINYNYWSSPLAYGGNYRWKVVAKSGSCSSADTIQTFKIRTLPDLVVDTVIVPPGGGTSETTFPVSWTVRNRTGGKISPNQWKDYVFLTESLTDLSDALMVIRNNKASLDTVPYQYTDSATFYIPQRYHGTYFVVVFTDYGNSVHETTDTNNASHVPFFVTPNLYADLSPDTPLAVSSQFAFSEDTLTVTCVVKNKGAAPIPLSYWMDRIYLSKSDTLNTRTAYRLSSILHYLSLDTNAAYKDSVRIVLPPHIEDGYFIHLQIDDGDAVYEFIRENNNISTSDTIHVTMRPIPDLVIDGSVTALADTVGTNQDLMLQWVTKNEGAVSALAPWTDMLRLTSDTTSAYPTTSYSLQYTQINTLQSLSSAGAQATMRIPYNLPEGNYFFRAVSDIGNVVFEGANEDNNVSAYSSPVYVVNPDLYPEAVAAPDSAKSEDNINLSWTVRNIGKGGIYNLGWYDVVYLSQDKTVGYGDYNLGSFFNNFLLLPNAPYTSQKSVQLPQNISGKWYLIVTTDNNGFTYSDNIFEKNESNNQVIDSVFITLSPWPDLQITNITTPQTDTAGTTMTFTYSGKNAKHKLTNRTWKDAFYLSTTNSFNDPSKIFLTSEYNYASLDSGEVYTKTLTTTIPYYLSGQYYIVGKTDSDSSIFENTDEGNNTKTTAAAFQIMQLPNVNLAAYYGSVTADTFKAGKTVTVKWTGINVGTTSTIINSWDDAIYLSNNPYLDPSDNLLGTWTVNTQLSPFDSYQQTQQVTIPVNATGTLYFLVNIDKNNTQNDTNRFNNTLVLQARIIDPVNPGDTGHVVDSGGGVIIIHTAPADLVPVSFNVSSNTALAGQPLTVYATVKNNSDTAITNVSAWYDKVYLSTDNQISSDDYVLSYIIHNGALPPQVQYNDTLQFIVLNGYLLSGNFFLLFKTDDDDNVYEKQNENNNTAFNSIFIGQQQSTGDLAVPFVAAPQGVYLPGQSFSVRYRTKNIGTTTTSPYCKDAVYLSKDTVWDINDYLVGTVESNQNIAPQDTLGKLFTGRLVNVPKGDYHVIVRTDILNNIVEISEGNNTGISESLMHVDVKQLFMGIAANDTLLNNENLYYRLHVDSALTGQTMQLTLDGDTAHRAINRLYIKFANAPSGNTYDVASEIPSKANQSLIIPVLQQGDYYILASGNDTSTDRQPVTLLAQIIPFEITSVDASKGGNTGAVTVKINGAKFDSTTNFYLRSDSNGIIYPSKIYYTNSTQVFATFNLLNTKPGICRMVATKLNGDSTFKDSAFEIIKGTGSTTGNGPGGPGTGTGFVCQITNVGFEDGLETSVYHPASTRPNRYVAITIYYENKGSVDIPAPTRFIVSLKDNVPLGFSPDELVQNLSSLPLDFEERGGPPGILRPGANGFIKVYTIAYSAGVRSIDFMIVE